MMIEALSNKKEILQTETASEFLFRLNNKYEIGRDFALLHQEDFKDKYGNITYIICAMECRPTPALTDRYNKNKLVILSKLFDIFNFSNDFKIRSINDVFIGDYDYAIFNEYEDMLYIYLDDKVTTALNTSRCIFNDSYKIVIEEIGTGRLTDRLNTLIL